jgi:SHS2 domain-containing protein
MTFGQRAYRSLSHTADARIEVRAGSLAALYANAAFGLFDVMVDLDTLEPRDEFTVRVEAASAPDVLVDLLSELIAVAEVRRVIPCRFEVTKAATTVVEITVGADAAEGVNLRGPPVKAVTYHDLVVSETAAGWAAQVVFDV